MSFEDCHLRLDGNQPELLRYGGRANVPPGRGLNTPDGILPSFGPQSKAPRHSTKRLREIAFNQINFEGKAHHLMSSLTLTGLQMEAWAATARLSLTAASDNKGMSLTACPKPSLMDTCAYSSSSPRHPSRERKPCFIIIDTYFWGLSVTTHGSSP